MATFVLVHGAWRGGWAWERVAKQLREAGHSVYAPSLTGLAERHHLLNAGVNLTTHIQDIASRMEFRQLVGRLYPLGRIGQSGPWISSPGRVAVSVYKAAN